MYNTKFDIILNDIKKHRVGRVMTARPKITVNGSFLTTDTMPEIINGRTLVPLRALAEKAGFRVEYINETGETVVISGDKRICFKRGGEFAFLGDKKIPLEAAPVIRNNRMLVPVRAVADALGLDISWDPEKRHVAISE